MEDRDYYKEWSLRNADHLAEYRKAYYEKNKDSITEKSNRRYKEKKEHILQKSEEYRKNNKDKIKETNRNRYNRKGKDKQKEQRKIPEVRAKRLHSSCRYGALKRGLEFLIEPEDILRGILNSKCPRTGVEFVLDDPKSPWRPSIDRIDNSRGYTKDNIQIVSWIYNCAKHTYSDDTVLEMSIAIVKRNESHS